MLRFTSGRIVGLGRADVEHNRLFRDRAWLIDLAWDHHVAGRDDASVPIVLAQIDGLAVDVTGGKLFFSDKRSKAAEVVDDSTIAGLDEGSPVARRYFNGFVGKTGVSDGLSRHGVLHGRALAYDTVGNSTRGSRCSYSWSLSGRVLSQIKSPRGSPPNVG